MLRARFLPLLAGLAVLTLAAAPSAADSDNRKVFLNGIDLENVVVPVTAFRSCEVRFDAKGNVHITAPGFDMKTTEAKKSHKPAPKNVKLTKKYFLIAKENVRGTTQYQVKVYVNGSYVTTVRSNAADTVMDVTKYVKGGTNAVRFLAMKNTDKSSSKRSKSKSHRLSIQIGEGSLAGDEVTVTKTLFTYVRNASEKDAFTNSYTFTGR